MQKLLSKYLCVFSVLLLGSFLTACEDDAPTTAEPEHIPNAPTELRAEIISANLIRLSWVNNSRIAEGFAIERKDSAGAEFHEIARVPKSATTYDDERGLIFHADTLVNMCYRVYAYDADSNSVYSDTALIERVYATRPVLRLVDTDDSEAPVFELLAFSKDAQGFVLERAARFEEFREIARPAARESMYTDREAEQNMRYRYRLKILFEHRESAWSDTLTVQYAHHLNGEIRHLESPWLGIDSDKYVRKISYSPSGKYLACADNRVQLWNPETGQLLHEREIVRADIAKAYPERMVRALEISPDDRVVGVLTPFNLWLIDVTDGQVVTGIDRYSDPGSFNFSPDGSKVVLALPEGTLRVCDAHTGEELQRLVFPKPQEQWHNIVRYNAAGDRIYAIDRFTSTVRVWNPAREVIEATWSAQAGGTSQVEHIIFSGDRQRIILNERFIWNLATANMEHEIQPREDYGNLFDASPDMSLLLYVRYVISYKHVFLVSTATGEYQNFFPNSYWALAGVFSPDNEHLALISDYDIKIFTRKWFKVVE